MKKNLPVSQREIDYPESTIFISKTDTKGIVTYTNDSFVKISGFSREELIGKNHNVVRHPDMPEWAFEDLWKTVKSGHPWRGIVKNRAKNGDYYWVKATVTPVIESNDIVGYISLRRKPTRDEIVAAEKLYQISPPPSGTLLLGKTFHNFHLQTKLQLLVQPFILLLLGAANIVIYQQDKSDMVASVRQRAEGMANEIIDSANMLMVTGAISDPQTRKLLIKKVSATGNVIDLHLVRSDQVVRQFGPGLPEEHVLNDLERNVIASKKPYYALENHQGKPVFHAITPYLVSRNYHGTDCLGCHQVEVGSVNGASDIEIDMSGQFDKLFKTAVALIIGQTFLQLLLFFFIKRVVSGFVSKPVENITTEMYEMVRGNMTNEVDISGRDEMGEVLCSVQTAQVLLGSIIDQIATVSQHIDNQANRLSLSVSKVAHGSQTQSDSANQMASAVEQLTVSIDQVAENAEDVRRVSERSKSLAAEGSSVVQHVVGEMTKITDGVMEAAKSIKALGEKSNQIQNIVKTIKDVAEQTNLLALNAAIEAARAGEQGRGFAVVADSVRKLAENTSNATLEITGMIEEIRSGTSTSVHEMEAVVAMVKSGLELAQGAGISIVKIDDGASRVLKGVEDISLSISEQSQASRDIAVNVEKVAQMSEKTSEAVGEISKAVEILKNLSAELQKSMKNFRV